MADLCDAVIGRPLAYKSARCRWHLALATFVSEYEQTVRKVNGTDGRIWCADLTTLWHRDCWPLLVCIDTCTKFLECSISQWQHFHQVLSTGPFTHQLRRTFYLVWALSLTFIQLKLWPCNELRVTQSTRFLHHRIFTYRSLSVWSHELRPHTFQIQQYGREKHNRRPCNCLSFRRLALNGETSCQNFISYVTFA